MARAVGWLLLFCLSAWSVCRAKHPTSGWFLQKLDHFDQKNSTFWQQRYFMNGEFYKPGGPVFCMISGATPINWDWISRNYTWIAYAKRLGALCILLEHRFYGYSQPTGNLSAASLRYLSSRQALADIVNFRNEIAKKMGLTKNKWVLFGGSYGGFLAVWARTKHPELFSAAVGSSAPLQARLNFKEFHAELEHSLETHNRQCLGMLRKAVTAIMKKMKHPEQSEKLQEDFGLCNNLEINSKMDEAALLETILFPFAYIIKFNKNAEDIKKQQIVISIDDFCDIMTNTSLGSPYSRYSRTTKLLLRSKSIPCVYVNYNGSVESLSDPFLDTGNSRTDRQWFYQRCTEFGFFQTTDSKNQSFSGLPLRYFVRKCSDVFGSDFSFQSVSQGVLDTNMHYSDFSLRGSKIILLNGSLDPWHTLGLTESISEDILAVFMKGESHCADMHMPMEMDSAQLIQARENVFQRLHGWLTE